MQFGKKEVIPGLEAKLKDPTLIKHGEAVIRRRGCFACHDIKGMENEGRIAPELSSFGRKMIAELEFGDSHISWNEVNNPYIALLGLSKFIICTSDSVSMISEAIYSRKSVFILIDP